MDRIFSLHTAAERGKCSCNLSPRVLRGMGKGRGSGGRALVNFAHRVIREEGPKSRKMGSPWSSQFVNFDFCACAHNSLSDVVVPRLWDPIITVIAICDPLTIGDTPMCSIGMIDR